MGLVTVRGRVLGLIEDVARQVDPAARSDSRGVGARPALPGRSAAKTGWQAVGRRQRNGVFVCLVRGHGTISPWAARIRADAFFVPSLPVRRRRAWPSPMIAWWPSWTWGR